MGAEVSIEVVWKWAYAYEACGKERIDSGSNTWAMEWKTVPLYVKGYM